MSPAELPEAPLAPMFVETPAEAAAFVNLISPHRLTPTAATRPSEEGARCCVYFWLRRSQFSRVTRHLSDFDWPL